MSRLDPHVSEFETLEEAEAHDVWVRAKVQEALNDPGPLVPHDQVKAQAEAIVSAGTGPKG